MTRFILSGVVLLYVLNLLFVVGNWETLTIVVIFDIMIFILVRMCRMIIMYGVMFILVLDLFVCVYVIYL